MIKLEKTNVCNWEAAFRGMRNPMNSWHRSDTDWTERADGDWDFFVPEIGPDDLRVAANLRAAGSDHRKYERMILVSVDITAPLYWWKEYDTYKVGTVANSTSTMHKIHASPFSRADFSCDRMSENALACLDRVIDVLETSRLAFNETKDRAYWDDMIQLLPSSYNQKRTCTLTYENLVNMYFARHNHKLPEWHEFCAWVESLPYAKELILAVKDDE